MRVYVGKLTVTTWNVWEILGTTLMKRFLVKMICCLVPQWFPNAVYLSQYTTHTCFIFENKKFLILEQRYNKKNQMHAINVIYLHFYSSAILCHHCLYNIRFLSFLICKMFSIMFIVSVQVLFFCSAFMRMWFQHSTVAKHVKLS